jgi:hypothetical protein
MGTNDFEFSGSHANLYFISTTTLAESGFLIKNAVGSTTTTSTKGVVASILVGLISALGIILLSQETYNNVYHLVGVTAPMPINNPAIISVPLSFITLVIVSLLDKKPQEKRAAA